MTNAHHAPQTIAIIGGGPAGLFAAEYLASRGFSVDVYERKPSLARKFLMAGRGGLNITHSENIDRFIEKYGDRSPMLAPSIAAFTPSDMRDWCAGLGQDTFIGSSGRVFPHSFKASPLLRAWQKRLEELGVRIHLKHQWSGWDADGALIFTNTDDTADNATITHTPAATLLALGGASWPKLGSDGSWVAPLAARGIDIAPLRPANCGFYTNLSRHFLDRFAGTPIKPAGLTLNGQSIRGDIMVTQNGIEGGAVYALSAAIRTGLENKLSKASGSEISDVNVQVDLHPDLTHDAIAQKLTRPFGRLSLSNVLRKYAGLSAVSAGLVQDALHHNPAYAALASHPAKGSADFAKALTALIKAVPVRVTAPFAIDRAISSAGGICFDALDGRFMLKNMKGVFVAGEMMDWEAPTGGYLLQATFATALGAAKGIEDYLKKSG